MNSMADALSHQCLLRFAADFGLSGVLLSTLEVGEIFLSCEGEQEFEWFRFVLFPHPIMNAST